jgi:hypothetical protein
VPAIYSVTISAADVGSRVMIRRRLTDGRDGFGDVVGELLAWDGESVTIRTRSETVTVPNALVVAAKRVPPAVPRRRSPDGSVE